MQDSIPKRQNVQSVANLCCSSHIGTPFTVVTSYRTQLELIECPLLSGVMDISDATLYCGSRYWRCTCRATLSMTNDSATQCVGHLIGVDDQYSPITKISHLAPSKTVPKRVFGLQQIRSDAQRVSTRDVDGWSNPQTGE
jgi:hypothetical protein